ncbi:IS1595 family transposase, partial [Lentimicrobium sp. L6]|uniref:IS1595 family transposase n=1 Tax=Lentimicrobium sp. L6 TaxID=2735916 RepID=UPI001556576C
IDRQTFKERFTTKEDCYNFLAELKWSEGYSCTRCDSHLFIKGKQPASRRCSKCGYDESTTTGTLFHKLKFGIDKAFEMMYEIVTSKKGANSIWLAEHFGVNQKTAWLFRQKVQVAMKSSEQFPLEDEVHVDEFEIGTPQTGEQGRSKSDKKVRVVIAFEHRDGKSGRGYAKVIQDYSSKSLKPIFDHHIKNDAMVLVDGWAGYKPLKENYPNLTQTLSDNGKNFKMLHIQIRNFKNWLRGVHSYCNKEYLQNYIDEYFFRFNRRNHRQSILDKIIQRCVEHKPIAYASIKLHET